MEGSEDGLGMDLPSPLVHLDRDIAPSLPHHLNNNNRNKVNFMKPFKIYENFRSAVSRGVRKNSRSVYEVCSYYKLKPSLSPNVRLKDKYDGCGPVAGL